VLNLLSPVDPYLFLPLEVTDVGNLTKSDLTGQVIEQVHLMDLNGNEGLNLGSDQLGLLSFKTHYPEIVS
jgi:hypothetical protein